MAFNEDDLREMMGEGEERCPLENKTAIPAFMLKILNSKWEATLGFLGILTDLYKNTETGTEKKEIYKHLKGGIVEAEEAINQYDFLVAMLEDDDESEKK